MLRSRRRDVQAEGTAGRKALRREGVRMFQEQNRGLCGCGRVSEKEAGQAVDGDRSCWALEALV